MDYDGATNFYYGACGGRKMSACSDTPCVRAEYFGLTNGMDAIIVFKSDGSVEIVDYGAGKLGNVAGCKMSIGKYRPVELARMLEGYHAAGFGVMRISSALDRERNGGENRNSKVTVQYE